MSLSFRSGFVFFIYISILFLGCSLIHPLDAAAATKEAQTKTQPMDFLLMYNGNCQEECTQWISADGDITPGTPARLKAILKTLGGKKLPIVLQSYGGDLDAAFAMGRMIRAAGLDTSIGRARLPNCPMLDPRCKASMAKKGPTEGEVFAGGAYCFSACPFVLMGGTSRLVGSSYIGLHQPIIIHTHYETSYHIKYKVVNGKKVEVSRTTAGKRLIRERPTTELTKAQREKFFAYFKEMGVSADIFDTMMIATPNGMGNMLHPQAIALGIINGVIPYDEEPGFHFCGPDAKESVRCPRNQKAEIVPAAALAN